MEAVRVVIASNVGLAAANETTRYAINGVHVVEGQDGVWAVATEGRMLACTPAVVVGEFTEAHEAVWPAGAFVGASFKERKKGPPEVTENILDLRGGRAEWWPGDPTESLKPESRGVVDAETDRVFPPYEECFGADLDRVWVSLNAKALRKLCKAINDPAAGQHAEFVTLGIPVKVERDESVSDDDPVRYVATSTTYCIAVLPNQGSDGVGVVMPATTPHKDCQGEYARRAAACARKRPPEDPSKKAAPDPVKPDPMDAVVGPSIAGAVVAVAMAHAAKAARPA